MPRATFKISFDTPAAVAHIRAANRTAIEATGLQVLKDVGQYVPEDQGGVKASGISNSGLAKRGNVKSERFVMRWDTPYAQYLWHGDVMHGNPTKRSYGPEKLKFTEALAREEWAKYAQEVHGAEWKKTYQAALERNINL